MQPTTSFTKILHKSYYEHLPTLRRENIPVIDVRSEAEFAKGAIPGAINCPLLSNSERHDVGLTYKTVGHQEAIELGLDLVSRKASAYFDELVKLTGHRPALVYCWRGGMRSGFVARWLRASGQDVTVLDGGYKTFRRHSLDLLARLEKHPLVVLNGHTGVGKTDLLLALPKGFPFIDFEGLANHRGSAFGDFSQKHAAPTPQNFENQIAETYFLIKDYPTILVEIENFLGPLKLSMALRKNIEASPMIFLSRDFDDRVQRIAAVYTKDWSATATDLFATRLTEYFTKYLDRNVREELIASIKAGRFHDVIAKLLQLRYDRLYDKSLARHRERMIAAFNLSHEWDAALRYIQERFQ